MMRSLYSGVSGLKTHQTKMDVIGNNIANVNTTAYKSSSIVFSELMSQTTQKASGANASTGTGGTNARQIGLGVRSGAINTNITTQGASQSTGNPFDIMISGEAFFIVSNGTENMFTRDGSFYVDGAGNLAMTSTGFNVMGWQVDESTQTIRQDTVSALRIMSAANMTYPPEATSQAYVAGILDKNDPDVTSANGKVMNLNFYDNLGYSYTAKITMRQSDIDNEYSIEFTGLLDSNGEEIDISSIEMSDALRYQELSTTINFDSLAYRWDGLQLKYATSEGAEADETVLADLQVIFGQDGALQDTPEAQAGLEAIAKAYGYEGSLEDFLALTQSTTDPESGVATRVTMETMLSNTRMGATAAQFPLDTTSVEFDGRMYDGATITYDADNGKFDSINGNPKSTSISLGLSALGGNFSDIEVDFSESSMFDNKGTSTVGATSGSLEGLGAGRRLGDMIGVSIQQNGMIYATYDNGMTKLLGQIATAEFANASGLEKKGDNLYGATLNSGEFDGVGVDVTGSGGYMSTGQLEMSNVDLSSEFTEMITTQRGFQANSRIITVSDTLLEELTNLKR
ncbi:MAG: flagellar hook-basal body complex protein [Lachnospiraceae bacterium]|nr:flagellar hook-basal body complex protein [Lachnospiraceae bacterium]